MSFSKPEERIAALEGEVQHWKANHRNMVDRTRILIDRADLPLERVKAFELMGEMQERLDLMHDALKGLYLYQSGDHRDYDEVMRDAEFALSADVTGALKLRVRNAVLAENEACARQCDPYNLGKEFAERIRGRKNHLCQS